MRQRRAHNENATTFAQPRFATQSGYKVNHILTISPRRIMLAVQYCSIIILEIGINSFMITIGSSLDLLLCQAENLMRQVRIIRFG